MEVYVVGEDEVTKTVIQRILDFCSDKYSVIGTLPARGGQIKSLINNFNQLSAITPVIMLTDLDQFDCPPELLQRLFQGNPKNPDFHIRVAIDEAEAWLMADREGFSRYFKVPLDKIPGAGIIRRRKTQINEMNFRYKSSLYLMREIIPLSTDQGFKTGLIHDDGISKGPQYNFTLVPFIQYWNIENAMRNSSSLERTVRRLKEFVERN